MSGEGEPFTRTSGDAQPTPLSVLEGEGEDEDDDVASCAGGGGTSCFSRLSPTDDSARGVLTFSWPTEAASEATIEGSKDGTFELTAAALDDLDVCADDVVDIDDDDEAEDIELVRTCG